MGDFNGWHPSWDSPTTNKRGKITQRFINNYYSIILLIDKSTTHFSTHNTYTHIGLTLCSPILATTLSGKYWTTFMVVTNFLLSRPYFQQLLHKNSTDPFYTLAEGILISVRTLQRSAGDVSDPIKYIYSWSAWLDE